MLVVVMFYHHNDFLINLDVILYNNIPFSPRTITLQDGGWAKDVYSYAVKLDFKDSTDKETYPDISEDRLDTSTGFLNTLAEAIATIDMWLDGVEIDKFEEAIYAKVLLAGLEVEVGSSYNLRHEQTFTLYSKQAKLDDPDSRTNIFTISTSDPFYQEKLTNVIEAYAARDLMHKISKRHPEMPIVYDYDNYTFEVPFLLRAGFVKEQLKDLSRLQRNLFDNDEAASRRTTLEAGRMDPLPITRKNLEILIKVMDADTLGSRFH